ncbi:MAG: Holliday junction resolvase Hjc [Candidatus Diapherotrites archaeon]|nr:Holliday junction resolvase Hjc [Candidatus Diapherotrites archaeon]
MSHYNKGSAAERELITLFDAAGFAVVRVAGSGTNALTDVDLIVLRSDLRLAIESKAWAKKNLSISKEQFEGLLAWAKKADCRPLVAWKYPREGWFLLDPSAFHVTPKFYAITHHTAIEKRIPFEVLVKSQTVLGNP